jgi:protein-L-isoaspartate(D-aspartate) O-methyltransferase
MEDTYLHKGLRKKLVEEIKSKGIRDRAVLDAVGNVPRHFFMDSSFTKFAYKDQAFPIGSGQTISQPYTVAFQTELLKVKPGDRIMEIGTGSGYQAAILLEMGARVYTIERIKKLMIKTKTLLPSLGYNPHFFYGDGYSGLPTYAKFDKILITAAATQIPENLLDQLKTGGRMVLPIGSSYSQVMTLVVKTGENDYKKTEHGYFVFVPMLKGKN